MPNFIEIGWEMTEKLRLAGGGKEKLERRKKTRIEPVGEPYREVCLSP